MKGALHVLFTFVLPLAAMTSYPAEALLGLVRPGDVVVSLGLAVGFAAVSRLVFLRALRRYTSASS